MILFLQSYKKTYSSLSQEQFNYYFSYAVYALLEISYETEKNKKDEIERRYGKNFLTKLETIANEITQTNRTTNSSKTNTLIQEILKTSEIKFLKQLKYEIYTFLT